MVKIEIIPESIQFIKLTDEEYFSEKYKEYISNSKLSLLNPEEGGSIEKFNSGFQSQYSESFELGSAIHAAILQPEEYKISDIRKPSGKLGLFAIEVYNFRKQGFSLQESFNRASIKADYYSKQLTPNRLKKAIKESLNFYLQRMKISERYCAKPYIYLSNKMFETFSSCLKGIRDSKIGRYIRPSGLIEDPESFNEYAIFCEIKVIIDDKITIIKLKAKLDNFTIDHEEGVITLNDLKTTGKSVTFFMGNKVKVFTEETGEQLVWYDGSFQKYHYYRQMGLYMWLLQAYIQKEFGYCYKSKANMLVVETIPNYKAKIYPVNGKQIQKGLEEFKQLITLLVQNG